MPFVDANNRVTIKGPDVPIGGQGVTGLALLLHELTTNAAKFGALSSLDGRIHLDCSVRQHELLLTWREQGGPLLNGQPQAEGFGSLLTNTTVRSQFGGQISREWHTDGLLVRLVIPLECLDTQPEANRAK